MTTTAVLLIAGADGEAVLTLTGAYAVEIRMVRDTSGSGWVSWDSHQRNLVMGWVKALRAAGVTADEANDNDDWQKAFLYVGGAA